jgi:hypothetical protein
MHATHNAPHSTTQSIFFFLAKSIGPVQRLDGHVKLSAATAPKAL